MVFHFLRKHTSVQTRCKKKQKKRKKKSCWGGDLSSLQELPCLWCVGPSAQTYIIGSLQICLLSVVSPLLWPLPNELRKLAWSLHFSAQCFSPPDNFSVLNVTFRFSVDENSLEIQWSRWVPLHHSYFTESAFHGRPWSRCSRMGSHQLGRPQLYRCYCLLSPDATFLCAHRLCWARYSA